jgi:serine/threonine protein kinase
LAKLSADGGDLIPSAAAGMMGTAAYMSPSRSGNPDFRTDLFSFGAKI